MTSKEKNKKKESKDNKKSSRFYIIAGILLVLVLFLSSIFIFQEKQAVKEKENSPDSPQSENNISLDCENENCQRRLIDGALVEENINPFIFAAIIDNHPDARPALGLSQAEIVYDVPAEGGINRYLALFDIESKNNLQVGPVRSVRPYFIDIAQEYQSMISHCGGSPEALARISKEKILNFNEFYNGAYFERSKKYPAPHNVIANFDDIKDYLKDRNYTNSNFPSWRFKDKKNIKDIDLFSANLKINIKNGQKQYEVLWDYDLDENIYLRSLAGKKQTDSSGEQIKADNLIFQFVQTKVLDSALRLKIDLESGGEALVCLDGFCKEAYWKKADDDRTRYFDKESQEEFVFNAGQTWVHLVDENTKVEY